MLRVGAGLALAAAAAAAYPHACVDGLYRDEAATEAPCPGFSTCPAGSYCLDQAAHACPAGRYGAQTGSSSAACDGACSAGYYCPEGSTSPEAVACHDDADTYCPAGSGSPEAVSAGYYSLDTADGQLPCAAGSYCVAGVAAQCAAGTYGASAEATAASCDGACAEGFYCPAGSTDARQFECGAAAWYCPAGSGARQDVLEGYYAVDWPADAWATGAGATGQRLCEPGSYCVEGVRYPCPAGRYGAGWGSTSATCDGACAEGYYCPEGSSSADAVECDAEEGAVFCPAGSTAPEAVSAGYYAAGGDPGTRSKQEPCLEGHYCPGDGRMALCPAGRYGSAAGLSSPSCSGACSAGHYCPEGSTSPEAVACHDDANTYCPAGSGSPWPVPLGYYSQAEEGSITLCPPGSYCVDGVRALCPAGTYGAAVNATAADCDGACSAGWYCPEGSTSAAAVACGGRDVFCPQGSALPTLVGAGNYSAGGANDTTHPEQRVAAAGWYAIDGVAQQCPAGRYGAEPGLASRDCSGPCAAGYYCEAGSTLATQFECGSPTSVCAEGSAAPAAVAAGYYTYVDGAECPPGQWRNWSLSEPAAVPEATGLSPQDSDWTTPACELCPEGSFKPGMGDEAALCLPCPEWSSTSSDDRRTCDCHRLAGGGAFERLVFFNDSECVSVAADYAHAPSPLGADALYTLEPEAPQPCEPGFYCDGEGVRYPCPAGRYGARALETDPECTGACEAGHYCAAGSTDARQFECGAADLVCAEGSSGPVAVALDAGYHTPGTTTQTPEDPQPCEPGYYCVDLQAAPCPAGRYGSLAAGASADCEAECPEGWYCPQGSSAPVECGGADVYCPAGSAAPTPVSAGHRTVAAAGTAASATNATQGSQAECSSGHFCVDGVQHACPPGRFGWQRGLTSADCDGPCAAGYMCPSFPDADEPSTVSTRVECGDATTYCPEGTGNAPRLVEAGHYSWGGDGDSNATRTEQLECPAGWWCRGGVLYPCAAGRYGALERETRERCSGLCPPGHYCPSLATVAPIECAEGTYAVGGATFCSACPHPSSSGATQCKDSRACCSQ